VSESEHRAEAEARSSSVTTEEWRGVAAEREDDVTGKLSAVLRARSRRLLGSLLRPHRRALWWLGVLIVTENAAAMAGPYLVKLGIDRGIPPLLAGGSGDPRALILITAAFVVVAFLQAITFWLFFERSGRIGQALLFDLRTRLFDHFQSLSLGFHERYTSGRVISRLTSDIEALNDLLEEGVQSLVMAALSIVTVGGIMLVLDWPLGLVALLSFPVVVLLTSWFRRHSEQAYRATREAIALVIVHFTESLGGIRAVHAFRREPRNQAIFDDVNDRYRQANAWSVRLGAVYGPGLKLLGHVTIAVVMVYGAMRVLDGRITVGVLAAFLLYLRRFFEPMQDLSQFYNVFQAAAAALEKLSGVLEEEPAVVEPKRPTRLPRNGRGAGHVRLDGVDFAYRDGLPLVLEGIDLDIPAGQTIALVGETGAGKSTVARLIARFYDPVEGTLSLDGVDLRALSDVDLRRAVVMVTQESFLFSGTVADNIGFGRPGAERAEIEAATRAIGAHDFIAALPDGYDTDVKKRGGRLSSGQRQLVSFARAFLADPRVLILDEATSSLDIPSERLVQRALRTLLADRTAVIIAHRLTTVEIADRVVVVDNGRIVEDGRPVDLIAEGRRYSDLHEAWVKSLA
jgi:ATP-binding cassette subfamily B protein